MGNKLNNNFKLSYFEIAKDSPIIGKALNQLRLKQHEVQILRIDRKEGTVPIPRGRTVLKENDIVYFISLKDIYKDY